MNISILCSDENHPVVSYLLGWIRNMSSKGHLISLFFKESDLSGGDILFLISCSQIIKSAERNKYKAVLVLHASDLPEGRGWSPHIWAILNSKNKITLSLIEATEPVDSGAIWMQTTFKLEGHELLNEINKKLFEAELYLMSQAVEKVGVIKPIQQIGNPGDWMRKRTTADSRIDPYKTIADQFNLLRVADPERYPTFFEYQGIKYLLKIEKAKSE